MGLKSERSLVDSAGKPKSPADVIESLGFGWAQILYLVLGHGVWFVEASQMCLGVVLTTYVATNQGWTHTERASLLSFLFLGIAMGSAVGGYYADKYGRRYPIIICYLLAALVQLGMIISSAFWAVSMFRLALGFAHGVGLPASLAIVSETAPLKRRMLLQGLRSIYASLGFCAAAAVCVIDDPSYLHMHWRMTLVMGVIPPVIFLIFSLLFLHESPIILAHLGKYEEAKKSLEAIRRLNGLDGSSGKPLVDITFTSHVVQHQQTEVTQGLSLQQQLKVIFGRHLFLITSALLVCAFSLNCVLYGHMYAFPLVATAKASTHTIQPGFQAFVQSLIATPVNVIVMGIAVMINTPRLLSIGGIIGVASMLGFASTAGIEDRTGVTIIIYYVSQNLVSVSASFGFLATYQMAVDLYPAQISGTSAGTIVVAGRIGSIVIAYIYEMCFSWQEFYYVLAVLSVLTTVMPLLFLSQTANGKSLPFKFLQEDSEAAYPLSSHKS